jgi:DNA repair exonuclease SbcCD nuclease subunit
MNNILIFSDAHIRERDLTECQLVSGEIISLCKEHKITRCYNAGDTFDGLTPDSQSLDLYANFVEKLNIPITTIVASSHESTTSQDSILNHYGILSKKINLVREYKDGNDLFIGHFIIVEAKKGRFGATISKNDLKNYRYVFLGHQHSPETIDNVIQTGSVRYISFDESEDESKYVYVIQDYKGDKEKLVKIPLSSPYPMQDIYLGGIEPKSLNRAVLAKNSAQLRGVLDGLLALTKVRIIFQDFNEYKEFLPFYKDYEQKFVLLKSKLNFILTAKEEVKKEAVPFKNILIAWLIKNNINEEIRKILLEEINGI